MRLTRIYTRGGDRGETSLGDGSRVPKLDCRIGAFGAVDELNSALGVVLADPGLPDHLRVPLERTQNDLFDVGADLCVPFGVTDRLRVTDEHIERLEQLCDELNAELPPLKSFILPGGTMPSARLHVARTICRRTEREALVADEENGINPLVLAYLNRLSDFLYIAARSANAAAGQDEPLWLPGGTSASKRQASSADAAAAGSRARASKAASTAATRRRRPLAAPSPSPRGVDASATIFTVGKTVCRSRIRADAELIRVEHDYADVGRAARRCVEGRIDVCRGEQLRVAGQLAFDVAARRAGQHHSDALRRLQRACGLDEANLDPARDRLPAGARGPAQ